MFFASQIVALVDRAISPAFLALTVLEVVEPVAFVASAIDVRVDAVPVGLVIHPVAFINIAVDVRKLSVAVRSIIFPVSFVECAVSPGLLALAVSEATPPFAFVGRSTGLEPVERPQFSLGVRIVLLASNSFSLFRQSEVATVGSFGFSDHASLSSCDIAAHQGLHFDY